MTDGDTTAAFERALAAMESQPYVLRLYVAGDTMASRDAIQNARRICDEHLAGRVELEVVDLRDDPAGALEDMVLATPSLVRRLPKPLQTVVGDLSRKETVLLGLALTPAD